MQGKEKSMVELILTKKEIEKMEKIDKLTANCTEPSKGHRRYATTN